jgi:hypothetical protein
MLGGGSNPTNQPNKPNQKNPSPNVASWRHRGGNLKAPVQPGFRLCRRLRFAFVQRLNSAPGQQTLIYWLNLIRGPLIDLHLMSLFMM